MMKIDSYAAAAFLAACSLMPLTANAAVAEWSFSAIVRDIDGSASGMADYGVTQGTVLTATYTLDTGVAGTQIGDNVWYNLAVTHVALSAGSFVASIDTDVTAFNNVVVRDDEFDAVGASARLVFDNPGINSTGFTAIEFIDSDGELVNNTSFPGIPNFSGLDDYASSGLATYFLFQAEVNGVYTSVTAEIVSPTARIVPVPGALYLLGTGLIALWGVRTRL